MNNTHLENWEKETIISFDESSPIANIYTYNTRWQKHIETKLGIKPYKIHECNGREYEIEKKRISLPRVPRVLSPEARANAVNRLKKARESTKISENL